MTEPLTAPPDHHIDGLLRAAIAEDLGTAGDITTNAVVPAGTLCDAAIVAREAGVVAGLGMAMRAFTLVDDEIDGRELVSDGDAVRAGARLADIAGAARSILAAERTSLNLLGHLSGIATATRRAVESIAHTRATVVDTRKTTPGLRALEKYAVRAGGGANHRFGLFDAILIKDNHLTAGGGVEAAVKAARAGAGHAVKVEVEIDDPVDIDAAIDAGADTVLLDNMTIEQLREAVALINGRCRLEASGGITLGTLVEVAETGVDIISLGWLTHSAPRWDVALDFDSQPF